MKASAFVVPTFAALLLLGACSEPSSTQVLQTRVTTIRSPAQTCNRLESIEYMPDGVRVRLADTSLFVIGRADLSDCGRYALGSVVEAMLNPRIMQVVVEPGGDINAPEALLVRQRATTVQAFLTNAGFTGTQPPVLVQPSGDMSRNWGVVLAVADMH
jgi:hypothetical protein